MGKIASLYNRLYSDYIMPSRLSEYEMMIQKLAKSGYKQMSVRDFKQTIDSTDSFNHQKIFINRHDIDTDIDTAKEFFKIEKKYNVRASYYFRLSTLDIEFMKEIEAYGSEASYHFEEIAQYAKDRHIKSKETILEYMNKIKEIFKLNFTMIEDQLGSKIQTVCSHGDFVNRKIKLINNEITQDIVLRKRLGIICETYDQDLMEKIDVYIADRPYPQFYSPKSIFECIGEDNVIYMLTHPRQWRVNIMVNTIDNFKRVYEGFRW